MMINKLREATKVLHEQIEQENSAKHIMDHSISLEEYKLLLLQNFLAYRIAERQINKYFSSENSSKHKLLEKDLEALGVNAPEFFEVENSFVCESLVQALGAAYVIEGSSLGGMMISKEMKNCPKLENIPQQQFFNGDRSSMKGWNDFLKKLRQTNFSEMEKNEAADKAVETFKLFEKAFAVKNLPVR